MSHLFDLNRRFEIWRKRLGSIAKNPKYDKKLSLYPLKSVVVELESASL